MRLDKMAVLKQINPFPLEAASQWPLTNLCNFMQDPHLINDYINIYQIFVFDPSTRSGNGEEFFQSQDKRWVFKKILPTTWGHMCYKKTYIRDIRGHHSSTLC